MKEFGKEIIKKIILVLFLTFHLTVFSSDNHPFLEEGKWHGKLELNEETILPFTFVIERMNESKNCSFKILNGKEEITLQFKGIQKDSLLLEFPVYGTYLVLKAKENRQLNGFWINPNKTSNNSIKCTITKGYVKRFEGAILKDNQNMPTSIKGRWETTFEPKTTDAFKAVGLFEQHNDELSGTFLTETGDYRYLEGNVIKDSFYLSSFDGSQLLLFRGKIYSEDSISGDFYRGKQNKYGWKAIKNPAYELRNPEKLTYQKTSEKFQIKFIDKEGKEFSYPTKETENKVVILQIMGTWCPNCIDETGFLVEMYQKYKYKGLEIIGLCYENGQTIDSQKERINRVIKQFNATYPFVLAGSAKLESVAIHFNMLNHIMSFPTTIFIGRDGYIKKIHTGFNGPGTGTYYEVYTKETELFLQELLNSTH
jgi:thiol-disulfide isomerase/thioredoxin